MRLILPLLMLSSPAFAQDALTFNAVKVVTHGEGTPSITFTLAVAGDLDVGFRCESGGNWSMQRSMAAGSTATLQFKGIGEGWHDCKGAIALTTADGGGEMSLPLRIGSLSKITVTAAEEDLDLTASTLTVKASRSVAGCELAVLTVGGAEAARTTADMSDPLAPSFAWSDGGQEVVKLDVVCKDDNNFVGKLQLSPWQALIPHEDVVFASNSAEIPEDEVRKLEASWTELESAVRLYGSVVDVQLFVAGYTDTVGDAGSNQVLSQRRAKAIGAWYRQRGFTGSIFYQGFGESVLAVPTPDQTDHPSNRRVLYILASRVPAVSTDLPSKNWRKL